MARPRGPRGKEGAENLPPDIFHAEPLDNAPDIFDGEMTGLQLGDIPRDLVGAWDVEELKAGSLRRSFVRVQVLEPTPLSYNFSYYSPN